MSRYIKFLLTAVTKKWNKNANYLKSCCAWFVMTHFSSEKCLNHQHISINCLGAEWHFRSGSTEVAKQVVLTVKEVITILYKAATGNGNGPVRKIVLWAKLFCEWCCLLGRRILGSCCHLSCAGSPSQLTASLLLWCSWSVLAKRNITTVGWALMQVRRTRFTWKKLESW